MDALMFHVAGLLKEPVGSSLHYDISEDVGQIDAGVSTTGPVKGHVKLMKTNEGILVDARLRVPVRLTCSRCLAEFSTPLDVRFSEEYRPVVDINTGLPLPGPEDRAAFTISENHELDLGEAVRQYALLALPIAPLCDAACAGLCPECGHNLNEGPCQCKPPVDERWGVLADYLKSTETNASGGADDANRPSGKKKRKR